MFPWLLQYLEAYIEKECAMLKALQLRFVMISQAVESLDKINWGGQVFKGVVGSRAFEKQCESLFQQLLKIHEEV